MASPLILKLLGLADGQVVPIIVPLVGHDIDRVVQKNGADLAGRFCHENARQRLVPHPRPEQHRRPRPP